MPLDRLVLPVPTRIPRRPLRAKSRRSYEDILTFPTFVSLIRDALVLHEGSGHASLEHAKEQGRANRPEAVYGKLGRVPPGLSIGFLEEHRTARCSLCPWRRRLSPCLHR